jgi:hypothetical protein
MKYSWIGDSIVCGYIRGGNAVLYLWRTTWRRPCLHWTGLELALKAWRTCYAALLFVDGTVLDVLTFGPSSNLMLGSSSTIDYLLTSP